MRVGFDGKNGYGYSSVGRVLVRNGLLAKNEVTLDSVKAWLRNNPEAGAQGDVAQQEFYLFSRTGR